MTVQIGPNGIVSDATRGETGPAMNGLYRLRGLDGIVLPEFAAGAVMLRTRMSCTARALSPGLVELRGVDGLRLGEADAVDILRHAELAVQAS